MRTRTVVGLALLLSALMMVLSLACSSASEDGVRSATVHTFLQPTAGTDQGPDEEPEIEPGPGTPTPTFRPTELAPTPAELERQLDDPSDMRQRRENLVDDRVRPVVTDPRVIAAMLSVPRHAFVPEQYLDEAYHDYPLPIGYGQTISQPSLVAMMTEMLDLEEGERVLEIGTGSGYQAAILYMLTDEVYTIEIIPELAGTAARIFDELGYEGIHTLRADGYYGWWEHAPFDAIIVTAAPDHLPSPLVAQLDPDGGRMVIPIGPPGGYQSLWVLERQGENVAMQRVLDVAFVPFTREKEADE
jgi:protein-L-isoaspartate(D-aspartate) O-methyltransferase